MRSSVVKFYHLKNRNGQHFRVKGLRVEVVSGCSHPPLKQIKGRTGALPSQAIMSVGHRGDHQQDENGCCFLLSMLEDIIHHRDKRLFSVL